jgi:hypothetical protein
LGRADWSYEHRPRGHPYALPVLREDGRASGRPDGCFVDGGGHGREGAFETRRMAESDERLTGA